MFVQPYSKPLSELGTKIFICNLVFTEPTLLASETRTCQPNKPRGLSPFPSTCSEREPRRALLCSHHQTARTSEWLEKDLLGGQSQLPLLHHSSAPVAVWTSSSY